MLKSCRDRPDRDDRYKARRGFVPMLARLHQQYLYDQVGPSGAHVAPSLLQRAANIKQGRLLYEKWVQGYVPPRICQYLFESSKHEADEMTTNSTSQLAPRGSHIFGNLAMMYRTSLGIEIDTSLSQKALVTAAKMGDRRSQLDILLRWQSSSEPVDGIEPARLADWAMGTLLEFMPKAVQEDLHDALLDCVDPQAFNGLLHFSTREILGTKISWRPPPIPGDSGMPKCVSEDDAVTLAAYLDEAQPHPSGSGEGISDLLGYWLQRAVASSRRAVTRCLILHKDLKLDSAGVREALRMCVHKGDVQALIALMEGSVDVDSLLTEDDVCNAAFCGDAILPHLALIMERQQRAAVALARTASETNLSPAAFMLHVTIVANNWKGFGTLLKREGTDINAKHEGRSPLHLALIMGRPLFAAALVVQGASLCDVVESEAGLGRTSLLHLACRPIRASASFPQHDRFTMGQNGGWDGPFNEPITAKLPFDSWRALVLLLLRRGLDIDTLDCKGFTPIRYLIRNAEPLERVKVLRELGARLDIADANGEYCLHAACANPAVSEDVVQYLLDHSPAFVIDNGIHESAKGYVSPLEWASLSGRTEVCQMLLSHGARVTPYHAAVFGQTNILCLQTYNVEEEPDASTTEVVAAVSSSGETIVASTVIAPHINAADLIGRTRLHLAVRETDVGAVESLVSQGALLHSADWCGLTPSHYAMAIGNTAILEFLEGHDQPVRGPKEDGTHEVAQQDSRLPDPLQRWSEYITTSEAELKRRAMDWPEKATCEDYKRVTYASADMADNITQIGHELQGVALEL